MRFPALFSTASAFLLLLACSSGDGSSQLVAGAGGLADSPVGTGGGVNTPEATGGVTDPVANTGGAANAAGGAATEPGTGGTGAATEPGTGGTTEIGDMRDLSGLEIAAEMAPGVNLWNTLDAYGWWLSGLDTQTAWGRPITTKEMITAIKDRGFRTLRVPVTWYQHTGPGPDYTIDEEWMDRVEEVANYALDNGMYAIVNIHHDDYHPPPADPEERDPHEGSWLNPTYATQAANTARLEKLWTQIAHRFKDYNDYLIFETMNEPREVGSAQEWSGGTAENRAVVNAFNLAAVNAIRATGSNNAQRFIMIPQVGANGGAVEDIVIPNSDARILISVHDYSPFNFTLNESGTSNWGTSEEVQALQAGIKRYNDLFISKGRAVIIGEWGAGDKDNDATRINYYKVFAEACADNRVTPIAWIYSFNRSTLTWETPELEEPVLDAFDVN